MDISHPIAKPSSYLQMESLETQQSVINLGKQLIDNFKDDEVDEITAWMCNYIAEKILLAEQTDNEGTKQECFDTILKLWERHSSFPDGKRPFENLEPILETLNSLNPNNQNSRYLSNPFAQFSLAENDTDSKNWLEISKVLDKTARILICFCIDQAIKETIDENTKNWLNEISQLLEDPIISFRFLYPDEDESKANQDKIESLRGKLAIVEEFKLLSENIVRAIEDEISDLENI
ncbi:hypothetical protein RCH20_002465 [Psychrobacter sp. PL15]|uniref:hypothetical protein n=1 Tax=Psychrobacter sp. PL15 TaxID=3071719 RepID=UPI002E0210D0|nr:hypothetical protein [Psychrobacter sp. PL15]